MPEKRPTAIAARHPVAVHQGKWLAGGASCEKREAIMELLGQGVCCQHCHVALMKSPRGVGLVGMFAGGIDVVPCADVDSRAFEAVRQTTGTAEEVYSLHNGSTRHTGFSGS